MPASSETVTGMGEAEGLRRDECAAMERSGVTPSLLNKAKEFGIPMRKVRDWYFQFGAPMVPHLIEIIDAVKAPKPKETAKKPAAKVQPPDDEGASEG